MDCSSYLQRSSRKSSRPKVCKEWVLSPGGDLVGKQLAGNQAKRCAAVAEGDVVALDVFQLAKYRLAVRGNWLEADTIAFQIQLRMARENLRGFVEKPLNSGIQHAIRAIGIDGHL